MERSTLWRKIGWPADRLGDVLLCWSSSWKVWPAGCVGCGFGFVVVETGSGTAAVRVPLDQRETARRIMREAKRHRFAVGAVLASLEAIGGQG